MALVCPRGRSAARCWSSPAQEAARPIPWPTASRISSSTAPIYSAPRLASATARKYGLSRSQLNTWRRAYREGQLAIGNFDGFVPALVVAEAPVPAPVPLNSPSGAGRMEILSANGRRVIVDRDVDVDVLVRILRGLETLE